MATNLYRETFSHVRSSYEVNVEDFERMKTKKKAPVNNVKKIVLIAAVAAILAAFGITAAATDFFGVRSVTLPNETGNGGLISMQGFQDSAEYKALYDHYNGGLSLSEAAEKYGLTVPERCGVFEYDEVAKLLGGELSNGNNTRWTFIVYEDGTLSADQEFTAADGTVVSYQLFRSVKGSLTEVSLDADALGEDFEEWDVKIGERDVGLVLGGNDRSLIVADLGDSFFAANVLAGKRADPTFGGPIGREQLEELAKSLNWDVLSRVAAPELPPEPPAVQYGAGVELEPQYIDEAQSFEVTLRDYGKTHFVTYMPTPEFGDVRFFLSSDGKVSDYEFHPMCQDNQSVKVAAVSFEDLNGDGSADVLALVDYVTPAGAGRRDIRIFLYAGDGEYELDWQLSEGAADAIPEEKLDVAAVRRYCKEYFAGGQDAKDQFETEDHVVASCTIEEGSRTFDLIAIGKRAENVDHWGVREIRVYEQGDSEPLQVIDVTEAGEDFVDGVYAGYTDCWDKEQVITALDMNFDGYPDLGVFGWTPNNTIPYYYWFWNKSAGRFEYAITLQGAEVDQENRQVIAAYKSGPAGSEYTYDTYQPDQNGQLRLVDSRVEKYGGFVEANDYEGMLAYLQSQYTTDGAWLTYGLFDLTGDGTEELIATYGTCEADYEAGVWSMDGGKMCKIGAFDMGHARLYVEDGKLIRLMGHMGEERISEIGFDGTEVTETLLSQRQLGPEEEYKSFPTPLTMTEDSDLSLLYSVRGNAGYGDVLDDYSAGTYALFDLEKDGVPELIVSDGTQYVFWTVDEGRVKRLGALDSFHASLRESEGHSLQLFYSNMSGAEISRVYRDGDSIAVLYITGWEWKEGVAGEDPGKELVFVPIADRALLKGETG